MKNSVSRHLLFVLTLVLSFSAMAQSHIFKGNSTSWSNILYTYDGKYIYQGNSTSWSKILYTFDGKHVYKGNSTSWGNILYTFDGKYILNSATL